MKTRNIVLLVVIALGIGLMIWQSASSFSKYTNFAQAKESGQSVHVVGQWIQDRGYSYNRQKDLFTFYMKDSTQHVEQVHYYDPKPTNFESAEKVVVVGQYQQEGFVAKRILMKCPSKYKNNQLETQQASTGPGQTNSYSRTEAQGSDL